DTVPMIALKLDDAALRSPTRPALSSERCGDIGKLLGLEAVDQGDAACTALLADDAHDSVVRHRALAAALLRRLALGRFRQGAGFGGLHDPDVVVPAHSGDL